MHKQIEGKFRALALVHSQWTVISAPSAALLQSCSAAAPVGHSGSGVCPASVSCPKRRAGGGREGSGHL